MDDKGAIAMKSIYEIFNHAKMDTSAYDQVDLTEIEKKRIKNRILGKVAVKKRRTYKVKLMSSAAIVLITSTILFNSPSAIAKIPFVGAFLENYLISSDEHQIDLSSIEPYKTVIGQSSINKYGTLLLNEVILEEGRLVISTTLHGKVANGGVSPYPTVQIDGKEIEVSSAHATQDYIDENTSILITQIDLKDVSLNDEHLIKLSYIYKKEIESPWVFEFKASGKVLAIDVEETKINQSIRLSNGQQIRVEKIVQSPLSITLYYKLYREQEYVVGFQAFDDEGRELLHSDSSISEDAHIRYYTNLKEINSITLIPYISREEDQDEPAFYEEFPDKKIEVNLNK